MSDATNPNRTPLFRLATIASAGIGGFFLGVWALKLSVGDGLASVPTQVMVGIAGALCTLAAAGAVLSFFAGVDESADYVFRETHFDKLTGVVARAAMVGKIAEAATSTIRTGEPVYLVNIDINRLKQINDAIGHSEGDALVRALAERLKSLVPEGAIVGRVGAGEFAILYPDDRLEDSMEATVERLIEALMQPYRLSNHFQSVGVSIGIVAMPMDGVDPVLVLRRSNLALQHARTRGVGTWATFEPDMGRVADHRQWIESELGTAFERGDFDLHYQPQHDLINGKVVGYEALIRWHHPEHGMIAPMEFIPIAEETGMILQIGAWVLDKACRDAKYLPGNCFVAVNISPVQFMTKDFVAQVRETMERTGIDPARLELEVTETAMMQDRESAAALLTELSQMGISVAVDDFGTGYSNLSYLIDFPFRKLKIDKSFVSRMDRDSSSGAVVSTIVGLSRALGVSTIAEGVETESQATLLKAAGCEVVQGYLYGRPGPLRIERGAILPVTEMPELRVANLH